MAIPIREEDVEAGMSESHNAGTHAPLSRTVARAIRIDDARLILLLPAKEPIASGRCVERIW